MTFIPAGYGQDATTDPAEPNAKDLFYALGMARTKAEVALRGCRKFMQKNGTEYSETVEAAQHAPEVLERLFHEVRERAERGEIVDLDVAELKAHHRKLMALVPTLIARSRRLARRRETCPTGYQ
jgi:hypothetical protein